MQRVPRRIRLGRRGDQRVSRGRRAELGGRPGLLSDWARIAAWIGVAHRMPGMIAVNRHLRKSRSCAKPVPARGKSKGPLRSPLPINCSCLRLPPSRGTPGARPQVRASWPERPCACSFPPLRGARGRSAPRSLARASSRRCSRRHCYLNCSAVRRTCRCAVAGIWPRFSGTLYASFRRRFRSIETSPKRYARTGDTSTARMK